MMQVRKNWIYFIFALSWKILSIKEEKTELLCENELLCVPDNVFINVFLFKARNPPRMDVVKLMWKSSDMIRKDGF